MPNFFIAAALITSVLASEARPADPAPQSPAALKALCEKIVDLVSTGQAHGFAIIRERQLAPLPDDEWAVAVRGYVRDVQGFAQTFGRYLGHELADERNVKDTFRRYVFIAKYEKHVLVWTFIFYRPKDDWKLHSWSFSQRIDWLFSNTVSPSSRQPLGPPGTEQPGG